MVECRTFIITVPSIHELEHAIEESFSIRIGEPLRVGDGAPSDRTEDATDAQPHVYGMQDTVTFNLLRFDNVVGIDHKRCGALFFKTGLTAHIFKQNDVEPRWVRNHFLER